MAVLEWGERHRRDLPWRRTRDPWAVLVSEVMLQQTQAARVVPRWAEFMRRFPTVHACAGSPVGDVVRVWAGLGYNRRAVQLHRTAVAVMERHAGQLPGDLDALLTLPGIGPYTARAVLAFAFSADVGVLDTNTARVVARAAAGQRVSGRASAQALADAMVPLGNGWAWNQSLLDLGALRCTRRRPACDRCPLVGRTAGESLCRWSAAGWQAPDPAEGSAGTGARQGPFAGSDRQVRGRLVDAMRRGPVPISDLASTAGPEPARAQRVADGLVADGLATLDPDGCLRLP